MRYAILALIAFIAFPINSFAQTMGGGTTFSVDSSKNKTDSSAISKIQKAASKISKNKCPAKTKFYSTSISISVGLVADGTYSANANYNGECKTKTKKN